MATVKVLYIGHPTEYVLPRRIKEMLQVDKLLLIKNKPKFAEVTAAVQSGFTAIYVEPEGIEKWLSKHAQDFVELPANVYFPLDGMNFKLVEKAEIFDLFAELLVRV